MGEYAVLSGADVTNEVLAERISAVNGKIDSIRWIAGLVAIASVAGAITVFVRGEVLSSRLNNIESANLVDRMTTVEATRWTRSDAALERGATETKFQVILNSLSNLKTDIAVMQTPDQRIEAARRHAAAHLSNDELQK